MNKYYYSDGSNNYGPFTLEELADREITKVTSVWIYDPSNDEKAGAVQDNAKKSNVNTTDNSINQIPPKTWRTESLLVTIFCFFPLGLLAMSNAKNVESLFNAGDIDGAIRHSAEAKKRVIECIIIGIALYLLAFMAFFLHKA
jgi:hypothetical protein